MAMYTPPTPHSHLSQTLSPTNLPHEAETHLLFLRSMKHTITSRDMASVGVNAETGISTQPTLTSASEQHDIRWADCAVSCSVVVLIVLGFIYSIGWLCLGCTDPKPKPRSTFTLQSGLGSHCAQSAGKQATLMQHATHWWAA